MCICMHTNVNCNVCKHVVCTHFHTQILHGCAPTLHTGQACTRALAAAFFCSCKLCPLFLPSDFFCALACDWIFCCPRAIVFLPCWHYMYTNNNKNVNDERVRTESLTTYKYFLIKFSAPLLNCPDITAPVDWA